MKNKKSTKRALLSSVLSLFICMTMLIGTTFAWFTDNVTSANNIIKSGNLDIEMYWAKGNEDPETATWNDASEIAIFNYDNWEPGYVDAKHIRIANEGSLAFMYQMRIVANGTVSKLADVIDVYYFKDATQLTRETVENGELLGTLAEVLGTTKNLSKTVTGELYANTTKEVTIAFKMQESAGNEYQNLSIGADFSVELTATQLPYEKDSFGKDYDDKVPSPEVPAALVRPLENKVIDTTGSKMGIDIGQQELDVAYQFEPTESYAEAQNSIYRYYHADFVISADKDVPAKSLAVAGYYDAWCSLNNDKWVALASDEVIKADTEIRLVQAMGNGSITVNYEELCNYGNDGIGFRCGAVDLDGSNVGTTLTVELRLYETTKPYNGTSGTANEETGEYITIGKFTYTFTPTYVTNETELKEALETGEKNIELANDIKVSSYANISIPQGVTLDGGGYVLTYNAASNGYVILNNQSALKNITLNSYRVTSKNSTSSTDHMVTLTDVVVKAADEKTGLNFSTGIGKAVLSNVTCMNIKNEAHLDPSTTVQVDYDPYGDVIVGGTWTLEATDCKFGSLHGWNDGKTSGSYISLNNTTYTVFRMHYWPNKLLYVNGTETAWSNSGAIPVAHDVGGCWSVQPAFK